MKKDWYWPVYFLWVLIFFHIWKSLLLGERFGHDIIVSVMVLRFLWLGKMVRFALLTTLQAWWILFYIVIVYSCFETCMYWYLLGLVFNLNSVETFVVFSKYGNCPQTSPPDFLVFFMIRMNFIVYFRRTVQDELLNDEEINNFHQKS